MLFHQAQSDDNRGISGSAKDRSLTGGKSPLDGQHAANKQGHAPRIYNPIC
jgi:hypothetical protein